MANVVRPFVEQMGAVEYHDGVTTAITNKNGYVFITKATAATDATLASPTAGTDDGKHLWIISQTAAAHVVTCTAGFGGGTTSRDVATFGGAINDGMELIAVDGVWWVSSTRNVTIA